MDDPSIKYYQYLNEKKELYNDLLEYIENVTESDNTIFFQQLENFDIKEKPQEMVLFFRLLVQICNNHCRQSNFINKIKQILQYYFIHIKKNFSNLEQFEIFKSSKIILLFLIEHEIMTFDKKIVEQIYSGHYKTNTKYHQFFYPEIKQYLESEEAVKIEQEINEQDIIAFKHKREIGQNEMYFCELIRNDSVEEFVSYYNRNVFILRSTIIPSIYETNPFLSKRDVSLIEYATFFGSIQIIKFLTFNNIDLEPPLWLFAIHSNNPEIIHFLEENQVEPPNKTFQSCFNEAIKCHHNAIAQYIKDVLITKENHYYYNVILQFDNYNQIPNLLDNNLLFFNLCLYNYTELVNLYITQKRDILTDINEITIISLYDV